eukprot:2244551-Amphidinium_carterae.1
MLVQKGFNETISTDRHSKDPLPLLLSPEGQTAEYHAIPGLLSAPIAAPTVRHWAIACTVGRRQSCVLEV